MPDIGLLAFGTGGRMTDEQLGARFDETLDAPRNTNGRIGRLENTVGVLKATGLRTGHASGGGSDARVT